MLPTNALLGSLGKKPVGKAAPARAARLTYTSTTALRQRAVTEYAASLRPRNPTAADGMLTSFGPGKTDYGTVYDNIIAGTGLRANDATDVFAGYLLLGALIVNQGQDRAGLTAPLVQGVRAQVGPLLAQNAKLTAPGAAAQLGEALKLQTVMLEAGYIGATQQHTMPAFRQQVAALFKRDYQLDFSRLRLSSAGFVRASGEANAPAKAATSASTAAPGAAARPAVSTGAAATGAVAGWFFRAVSGYPAAVDFEPVVLFQNGQYVEVGDGPVETLNATADRAARPAAWGTWRKTGTAYVLTNAKGQANSYTLGSGNWFPAYPAGAVPLKRAYEKTRGGSYGAGTAALFINKIQFVDATRFRQGENMGVSSPNAAGGRTGSASGTYRLQGHTLTLTYADGRTVRKSFALGAEGAPAHAVSTLVFIGGDAYTDTE